jgi:hypothetical protein
MKTRILLFALVLIFATQAFADDIDMDFAPLPQGMTNLESLRGADSAGVAKFMNEAGVLDMGEPFSADMAREFGWAAIGQGTEALVVLLDTSGRGFFSLIVVYIPTNPGRIAIERLFGWRMGKLKGIIRDLGGNGQDELVIPTMLGTSWLPVIATRTWPAVYRLEDGKYVEASRDFPNFYDKEVLPQLDKEITGAQQRFDEGRESEAGVALEEIQKDKILRILGRDPTAGLQQAYQWMNSDDSLLLQCAIATFEDIGGHEKELTIAKQALRPALQREQATRNGG